MQVVVSQPRAPLFRTFLDTQQYSDSSIAMYEAVFGPGFISPGGAVVSAELLSELQLRPSMRVLDVGCGIGGELLEGWATGVWVSGACLASIFAPSPRGVLISC